MVAEHHTYIVGHMHAATSAEVAVHKCDLSIFPFSHVQFGVLVSCCGKYFHLARHHTRYGYPKFIQRDGIYMYVCDTSMCPWLKSSKRIKEVYSSTAINYAFSLYWVTVKYPAV